MILIKIPVLLFFLIFFTACDLFSSKPDVKLKVTPEAVNPESSSSPDGGQSVSPQPLPVDSSAQDVKATLSKEQMEAFFKAVKEGDLQKVNLALEKGVDPILPDSNGNTSLIIASSLGKESIVRRLLKIRSVVVHLNIKELMEK